MKYWIQMMDQVEDDIFFETDMVINGGDDIYISDKIISTLGPEKTVLIDKGMVWLSGWIREENK